MRKQWKNLEKQHKHNTAMLHIHKFTKITALYFHGTLYFLKTNQLCYFKLPKVPWNCQFLSLIDWGLLITNNKSIWKGFNAKEKKFPYSTGLSDPLPTPGQWQDRHKLSSKNLLTVLFFFLMLNTMGQDCKDEKLSQQLPHKG